MRKRLRSTIKWGGTVLTVLLLVVWVWSAWWLAGFRLEPTGGLGVYAGRVVVGWVEPWSIAPVDGSWHPPELHPVTLKWWFDRVRISVGAVTFTEVHVPIWVLIVLLGTAIYGLWRCDRRRQPGLCSKCGYDLRGADHEVCPECGER